MSKIIYVVSTGGNRFPVESDTEIPISLAFEKALPRFEEIGSNLGKLTEITVLSDESDPGDPFYISTVKELTKLGKMHQS